MSQFWTGTGKIRRKIHLKNLEVSEHYADTFAGLGLPDYGPRETKLSHILEPINIGTGNRFERQYIMIVLLNHAYGCSDLLWESSKDLPWEYRTVNGTLMNPPNPGVKSMQKVILKQFEKNAACRMGDTGGGRRRGKGIEGVSKISIQVVLRRDENNLACTGGTSHGSGHRNKAGLMANVEAIDSEP
ncbi:uncharacterized protein Z519_03660 [Cladophialophora bantiana CBS 173.52]|uniref:Uncharacterized protein n=1 Tax=Cladophialophora bantiana (strain ATCC 10958 / CBS 173.52 / CDC B-1940 / NIH 8579) TaxID=1442370 RepID=A0A0D2G920_CLAB1|nr:uncharacterized protein Z519_03660 [Cladophialophora bantiana CBS 173.52]KIW95077.1 hypothetical protein Z519_03660 [Cladophialophora bantiana CBS 173.52]